MKPPPLWKFFIQVVSQMLVTVNPVIEVVEHRLHGSGELHVKIEVIGRKGNDEKCGAGKRQFFTTVQSLDILHFLLSITMIPHRGGPQASGQPDPRP